jgi:hypothetical protein
MGGTCSIHGRDENIYNILFGKPERKRPFEDLGVNGRIIFEWILKRNGVGRCGLDSSGSG